MKKPVQTISVTVLGALVLALLSNQLGAQGPPPARGIGANYVEFDNSHLSPETSDSTIRAFVATGSLMHTCLATLGETNSATINETVESVPTLLFCAPREAFGQKGVLVSVFFTGPVTQDLILTATIFQEGAKKYDPPVLCLTSDGC